MQYKYSLDFHISCYRTDINHRMRPSTFLDLAQDIATRAAGELSFGDATLKKYGCAWILARMQTRFLRPVLFNEDVRLDTWHRGLRGVNFIRDYQMVDGAGLPVVNSTSSWITMNLETRRLSRDAEMLGHIPTQSQCDEAAIEDPCPKLTLPRGSTPELIGTHTVKYSDVDFNGHANNVKYTVWGMDCLPEDLVFNHFLKEITINFNKEVHLGDTVELYHAMEDGAHIIEGRSGENQAFISKLVFEE